MNNVDVELEFFVAIRDICISVEISNRNSIWILDNEASDIFLARKNGTIT